MRINPHEIHIHDPEWLDVLYTRAPKVSLGHGSSRCSTEADSIQSIRDKYDPAARMTGMPKSSQSNLPTSNAPSNSLSLVFGTVSHDLHRKRRAAISPLFTKSAIKASETVIYEKAELLCESLGKQLEDNDIAEMRTNFTAWATEVISVLVFPKPLRLLEDQQAAVDCHLSTKAAMLLTPLQKQFPWLIETALRLPLALAQTMSPDLARSVALFRVRLKAFIITPHS